MTNINNKAAVTTAMTTAPSATAPLDQGFYALWANGQNGYVQIPTSSALTVSNGYPLIGGGAPVTFTVPNGAQIGFVSSSSGIFGYMKLGAPA